MIDMGTSFPEEMQPERVWEETADKANAGVGLPFFEKLRRARQTREEKTSPEIKELIQHIRDADADTLAEIYRNTIVE